VTKVLIINADDFGRSHGINRGVARAHDEGVVTSASAMVCWPAVRDAAALARQRPSLGVGLHVDLSESTYGDRGWRIVYDRTTSDRAAVAEEVRRQLACFRELFGREPTHLDSHQHVHREDPARSVLVDLGIALGVPVRAFTPSITYRGDFYGQTGRGEPLPEAIGFDALLRVLDSLPEGVTEVGCHPAAEPEVASSYADERVEELRVLCDPRLREAISADHIELLSFESALARLRETLATGPGFEIDPERTPSELSEW
jgi:predicted glycoside hydrolase/deacetylase ChbG (UPF0249 family)